MSKKIYIPTTGADCWKQFLAEPEKQWKKEFSARSLAYCWEDTSDFPLEIRNPIKEAGLELELLMAIPEYKVYLDTKLAPSQNDLFVLARTSSDLAVIMIEGKVDESFDKLVMEWNNLSVSRERRIDFLANSLEIPKEIKLEKYRYQLLHRTVSAILTAEKFHAKKAMMLVHSFSLTTKWFEDFSLFVKLFNPNLEPEVNKVYHCKTLASGIDLYLGWIVGDK